MSHCIGWLLFTRIDSKGEQTNILSLLETLLGDQIKQCKQYNPVAETSLKLLSVAPPNLPAGGFKRCRFSELVSSARSFSTSLAMVTKFFSIPCRCCNCSALAFFSYSNAVLHEKNYVNNNANRLTSPRHFQHLFNCVASKVPLGCCKYNSAYNPAVSFHWCIYPQHTNILKDKILNSYKYREPPQT